MKKIISVMLSILMIFSCMFVASATEFSDESSRTEYVVECKCTNHHEAKADGDYCSCCVACNNVDPARRLNCTGYNEETNCYTFCCGDCDGLAPCDCCDCCKGSDKGYESSDGNELLDKVWGEDEKQDFVDAFQSVLKKISDFFDTLFDTIFEFLRIDEVIGNNQ